MQRIKITELDLSTMSVESDVTDIVYVPGFSTAQLVEGGTAVEAHVPTLCKTLVQFESFFGKEIPTFAELQAWPSKFAANAIPSEGNCMFAAGAMDPSYIYAKELVMAGIPVIYERMNASDSEITVEHMYSALTSAFASDSILNEKGEYEFKYLTSGGYPTFEYDSNKLANLMMAVAGSRGDAIAFIDHTNNPERPLLSTNTKSVFKSAQSITQTNASNAAMITPYATYNLNDGVMEMPGSFAYLVSLAKSIKTNPNWLAIAGVSRGLVPDLTLLNTDEILTNTIAESYVTNMSDSDSTGISINPITNIKPYGYCIWGNRTLKLDDGTGSEAATHYLNIRNMLCDIKKQLYVAAKALMFEQNNDVLWLNFKSMITPLLDQMVSGYGLKGFKTVKNQSSDKTKLSATVIVYPEYAVESFEINVVIQDEEVAVE